MYRQHFGITDQPLGKNQHELWDDGSLASLQERFNWLLKSPGLGLFTGEAGVGKTAILRHLTQALNPHQYQVIYTAETDFGRFDLYRNLALELKLEPAFRRAQLWRDIKARITELVDHKNVLPLWIIDEAQNLPREFFRDFPAFLNFAFDSRDLMTVWLVGQPQLTHTLSLTAYAALASRIQVRLEQRPISDRPSFNQMIEQSLKVIGCHQTLLADTGLEILHQASQGKPRQAGQILKTAMQLAVPKGLNHLPDELLQQAIELLR